MMKRFFACALILLALLGASARAETDGDCVYTLVDTNGNALTRRGGRIYPGDEYISGDDGWYRVVSVDDAAQTAAVLDAYQRQDKSFGGLLVEVVDSEYSAIPHVGDTVDVIINVQYDLGKWRGIGYEAFLNGTPAAKGTP